MESTDCLTSLKRICSVHLHEPSVELTHLLTVQPELFSGAVLLAPMLSLERVSKKGLNPYLR